MRLFRLFTLPLLIGLTIRAPAANTTAARLVLAAEAAKPGDTVLAGIHLKMAPKWHTYWRNPGDSGMPTSVKWTLPEGITAGDILWPVPEKDIFGGQTTYVYHDEVVLIVKLKLDATLTPGAKELKAKVSWLECEVQCVPGKAEVTATLNIGGETRPSAEAGRIEKFRGRLPVPGDQLGAQAGWGGAAAGEVRPLIITIPGGEEGMEFFPYEADGYEVVVPTNRLGTFGIQKAVKKSAGDWPATIAGMLWKKFDAGSAPAAFEVNLKIGATAPAAGAMAAGARTAAAGSVASPGEKPLWLQLIYAFAGGLILNVMPCVLPVISLKIFGFLRQSGESPARMRVLGLAYGSGVVLSLLALAAFVIALKLAGKAAGWGIQFQNPIFVVAVTTLVMLVALNLFGVFEVTLGGGTMTAATELSSREGVPGAFFNGALAVILATPCTAPFMAGALGYAFRQTPAVIALFFFTIGAGLALPYVLLCFAPGLMRFLPKPGAWMEKFKIALGFPVVATAMWLFTDVAATHYGEKLLWFGWFLVAVALAAWVYGEFYQRGRKRRGLALAVSLLLLLGGYLYAMEHELNWRNPPSASETPVTPTVARGDIDWQRWSAEAVAKARAEGHVVLVDFTAKWCSTCQVNKKFSIEIAPVREKLRQLKAVALLGDYSREDPVIAAELKKFDRAGVPLVLVYPKDADRPPLVLPEFLTPGIMLEALEKAGK